jgi:hypothetical protein
VQAGDEIRVQRAAATLSSDAVAQQALQRPTHGVGVIQDPGVEALWRLALALPSDDWLWSPETLKQRATRVYDLLRMCGMAMPPARPDAARMLLAAAAMVMAIGDEEIVALAQQASLLPLPYLTADGYPVLMPATLRMAMPDGAHEVFRGALHRLRNMPDIHVPVHPVPRPVLLGRPAAPDQSDEREVDRYRYLADAVARLPTPDASQVSSRLLSRFPWMSEAVRSVRRELALLPPDGAAVVPPLLLVGPPGSGKSRFLGEMCAAIGIPWRLLHSTDGNGATTLAGNGRGWRGGRPALPISLMADASLSTVGIIVDDVDRQASDDRYGTPQSWLLSVLEPGTASAYHDPYLLCEADLSTVSWLLTANDVAGISGALLDRVTVIEVSYPPPDVAPLIVQQVERDVLDELGWNVAHAPQLPHAARDVLLRSLGSDGSTLRLLRQAVRAALGAVQCGEDAAAAARAELARGRSRDDRPYAASRVGFARRSGWSG